MYIFKISCIVLFRTQNTAWHEGHAQVRNNRTHTRERVRSVLGDLYKLNEEKVLDAESPQEDFGPSQSVIDEGILCSSTHQPLNAKSTFVPRRRPGFPPRFSTQAESR